jgi:biotin carboxyl carrier protein
VQEGTGVPSAAGDPRTEAERAADHAAVARLADTLLPALMGRLAATHLGELEVREGGWHVRLRRPAEPKRAPSSEKVAERLDRLRGRAATRTAHHDAGDPDAASGVAASDDPSSDPPAPTAMSPAVGVFQAARGMGAGTAVRSGDRIAVVDVLGIPTDVTAPVDGRIAEVLVEPGTAVEYGQPLVRLDAAPGAR